MKAIIFTLAVILTSGSISLAQKQNEPQKERESKLEQMRSELNLTEAQVRQIREIHRTYQAKNIEKPDAELTADEKARMKQLKQEEREAIYAILTPEQQQKARENRKQNRMKPVDGIEKSPQHPQAN